MTTHLKHPSKARQDAEQGMTVVSNLMSYTATGAGKPRKEETSLYLSTMVFLYAVWEDFVEQLAIEVNGHLADAINPSLISTEVRNNFVADATPWELSVDPGWRSLWKSRVKQMAIGNSATEGKGGFGLNNATLKNVNHLFQMAGLTTVKDTIKGPTVSQSVRLPAVLGHENENAIPTKEMNEELFLIRCQAVHSAKTISTLYKPEVRWWIEAVRKLIQDTDKQMRSYALAKVI